MGSKNTLSKPIGVVGAGSFGTAVANILAENNDVLLFARSPEKVAAIQKSRSSNGQLLHKDIRLTSEIKEVAAACDVIFPIVPSSAFRDLMKQMAPILKPSHILIHGTKGLDMKVPLDYDLQNQPLTREHVKTMSEVILEETNVLRVGCLAGPNLAKEMAEKQPAASVVASHFQEVIEVGQSLLKNDRFLIYGSNDLVGIELCGVLKNIIAIGAGMVSGLGLGENAKALLISRGMVEMIYLGKVLGGNTQAFLGLAGVGDLIATCNSPLSRNYTVGFRLSQGESLKDIIASMEEVAEGVNTTHIVKNLAEYYRIRVPITESLYKIMHEEMTVAEASEYLMSFPFRAEIDFI